MIGIEMIDIITKLINEKIRGELQQIIPWPSSWSRFQSISEHQDFAIGTVQSTGILDTDMEIRIIKFKYEVHRPNSISGNIHFISIDRNL